jgi:hypothetical protein
MADLGNLKEHAPRSENVHLHQDRKPGVTLSSEAFFNKFSRSHECLDLYQLGRSGGFLLEQESKEAG